MNAEHTYTPSFTGGSCLPTGMMRQYLEGTLPRKSLHAVEKHLLDCDFCSNVLEDMDVSEHAETSVESISQRVNQRIAERIGTAPSGGFHFGLKSLGAGVAALLIIGLTYWKYHTSDTPVGTPAPDKIQVQNLPAAKTPETVISPTAAVTNPAPKEDEFVLRKTVSVAPAGTPASKTVAAATLPPPPAPVPAAESKTSPAPLAPPVAKEESLPESTLEKENYADLQIVSARVLQKMTKSESSSRTKARKNGQLVAPKDRGGAAFHLEDMPEYPGGDAALEEYLASHFKNPVKDKRSLTGKAVGVMFTVSSHGAVSDVEITKSISPELDIEIIRLISSMPTWSPGKHKGDITCVLAVTVH
jgi:hypothetical protein